VSLQAGDLDEAAALVNQQDEDVSSTKWEVNGKTVDVLRDLDDVLAPALEVHTSTGKYFWIDWNQIISMTVHPPKRPADLLWRQASLSIEAGPDGEVYLPAIYSSAFPIENNGADQDEANLKLGRRTDWVELHADLVCGRGQKTLLVGDQDLPIMQLESIERQE
jgi:type VI secretion system protein ImpE